MILAGEMLELSCAFFVSKKKPTGVELTAQSQSVSKESPREEQPNRPLGLTDEQPNRPLGLTDEQPSLLLHMAESTTSKCGENRSLGVRCV